MLIRSAKSRNPEIDHYQLYRMTFFPCHDTCPSGGILVFNVSSEFEDNLIKKTVFRTPGEVVVAGETPAVRQTWKTLLDSTKEDGTLIFQKSEKLLNLIFLCICDGVAGAGLRTVL